MTRSALYEYRYETVGSGAHAPTRQVVLTLVEGGRGASGEFTCEGDLAEKLAAPSHEAKRLFNSKHASGMTMLAAVLALFGAMAIALVFCSVEHDQTRAQFDLLDSSQTEIVSVMGGESLWSIADSCKPEGVSTDSVVRWIRQRNGLDSSLILAGQSLVVPGRDGL